MAAEKLPDIASRLITSQFPGDDFSFLEPERLGTAHVEFHSLGSSATIAVGCRYDHLRSRRLNELRIAVASGHTRRSLRPGSHKLPGHSPPESMQVANLYDDDPC